MLIAIASTDGETVNEHFGKAERFLIFDITESQQSLIATRDCETLSTDDKSHPFDPERMGSVLETIKDCQQVYCTKIGARPQQELEKAGITPIIYSGRISSIPV